MIGMEKKLTPELKSLREEFDFLHKKIGDLEREHATRFYGKKAVLGSEVEKIEIQIENYRDNMSILIEKIEAAVSDANKAEREAKK